MAATQHLRRDTLATLGPTCRYRLGTNCEPTQRTSPACQSTAQAQQTDRCWNWDKPTGQKLPRIRRCTTAGTNRPGRGLRKWKRCARQSHEVQRTPRCTSSIRTGPPSQTPHFSDTRPCSLEYRHRHRPCLEHHIRKRLPKSSEDPPGIRRCSQRHRLHRCRRPTHRSHRSQLQASPRRSGSGPNNPRARHRHCRRRSNHSHKRPELPLQRRLDIHPHSPPSRPHHYRYH
mmetsp:Transcript_64917/g.174080  ORF Transcript_64917/g.174080 Transcript_64917/m.174080 type:complete len:230 (+) Transcript_64917:2407-3096(+)